MRPALKSNPAVPDDDDPGAATNDDPVWPYGGSGFGFSILEFGLEAAREGVAYNAGIWSLRIQFARLSSLISLPLEGVPASLGLGLRTAGEANGESVF
jgi:hypothetical protein